MLRKYSTRSDSKKFCQICGRNGHEDEACAAIPVTFVWKNGGDSVFLYGSWNQWQVKKPLMKDQTTGIWKIQISLAPGRYQYKFLVDGHWAWDREVPTVKDKNDKLNNVMEVVPAEFTHAESDPDDEEIEKEDYLILVDNNPSKDPEEQQERKKLFRVKKVIYELPAVWVSIKGSWDDWKGEIALKRFRNNFTGMSEFYVMLKLLPGTYQCKFLVDGEWVTNPALPIVNVSRDNDNNILLVPETCCLNNCPKSHDKFSLNWRREDGKWNDCGAIHHTLQGHSMNLICDKVYIFGGLANGKFTNSMYTYDVKSGEFDFIDDIDGDIPDPRAFHSSMVFGTKILIYGGFNEEYLTDYYSFNTLNSVWTQAEIDGCGPGPRERCSLVPYVEDKVVLFGGYYCTPDMEVEEYFNDLYVLNLSLMEWIKPELEGDLPRPRSAHTANFIHGKMYMFGGVTKNHKNLNDIWVLKATPTAPLHWKKIDPKGNLPEPRHGHSSVVVENNIIFFGGRGNGTKRPFDDLIVFDTINEQWTYPKAGGIRPTPRFYHASVALNEGKEIMIFGGVRPQEFLSYPRIYFLETKSNGQFEEIPERRGEEDAHRTD